MSIFLTSKACQDRRTQIVTAEVVYRREGRYVNGKEVLLNMRMEKELPEEVQHFHRFLRQRPLSRFHSGCFNKGG